MPFRISKVISDRNSTLMDRSLLNEHFVTQNRIDSVLHIQQRSPGGHYVCTLNRWQYFCAWNDVLDAIL